MKIGDTIRDENCNMILTLIWVEGGGKGVFLPSVGFPLITQKQ